MQVVSRESREHPSTTTATPSYSYGYSANTPILFLFCFYRLFRRRNDRAATAHAGLREWPLLQKSAQYFPPFDESMDQCETQCRCGVVMHLPIDDRDQSCDVITSASVQMCLQNDGGNILFSHTNSTLDCISTNCYCPVVFLW